MRNMKIVLSLSLLIGGAACGKKDHSNEVITPNDAILALATEQAKSQADAVETEAKLQQIGSSLLGYAHDHKGQGPKALNELLAYYLDPDVLKNYRVVYNGWNYDTPANSVTAYIVGNPTCFLYADGSTDVEYGDTAKQQITSGMKVGN